MICAAKRVQKSTIVTIARCSMPSPGGYCDWDPIGGNVDEYGRRNIRQCSALATTTGCTGTLPEHRLTPKGRAKFDERGDGSPQPQIPADLGCACGNLYGKMLES